MFITEFEHYIVDSLLVWFVLAVQFFCAEIEIDLVIAGWWYRASQVLEHGFIACRIIKHH